MEIKIRLNYLLKLSLLLLVISISELCALDFIYHKQDALQEVLRNYSSKYTKLSPTMESIGKSFKGRDLWVVEISAANKSELGIPNVKLIGNIHGNEAVGREILLHFIEFLGENYETNSTIQWLTQNTRLHILPSMNPDGFEISNEGICIGEHGRGNFKDFDLNRNFPDFYNKNPFPTQPETYAIKDWMERVPFILSASLHGGALVANYPFDTVKEMKWETLLRKLMETDDPVVQQNLRDEYIASLPVNPPSISPDNDVFIHLAKIYSNKHPTMHKGYKCPRSNETFLEGITNGAAWYPLRGGMQDYNYVAHGCMELTLEISCCKYPTSNQLQTLWEANKDALIELIMQAHMGVTGIVYDIMTGKPIKSAILKIVDRDMNFTTTKDGEFWRILLPGPYKLQIIAEGYHSKIVPFQVPFKTTTYPQLQRLYVPMVNTSLPLPKTTTQKESSSTTTVTLPTRNVSSSTTKKLPKKYIPNDTEDTPVKLKSTSLNRFDYNSTSFMFNYYHETLIIISIILMCLNL